MPEIRRLLTLNPTSYAVTLPVKYCRALKLEKKDYLEISLLDLKTIALRKHSPPEKQ